MVAPGDQVMAGQTVIILEAMKMETEVSAATAGTVGEVLVRQGDSVAVGQNLLTIVGS
jgi:oxaloacetate decarboxylase alpha subunit